MISGSQLNSIVDQTELDSLREEVARGRLAKHELTLVRELLAGKRAELIEQVLLMTPEAAAQRDSLIAIINVLTSLPKWLEQVVEHGEGAENLINIILDKQNV